MTSIFEGQPPKNKAETPMKTGVIWVLGTGLGYSSPIKVSTRKLRSSPIPNCFFRPTAWLFAISPCLAISRLQWTQRKKTKSAQRDKVRTDVGVESDERQDVIACKTCLFSWMNFLPGKWRLKKKVLILGLFFFVFYEEKQLNKVKSNNR